MTYRLNSGGRSNVGPEKRLRIPRNGRRGGARTIIFCESLSRFSGVGHLYINSSATTFIRKNLTNANSQATTDGQVFTIGDIRSPQTHTLSRQISARLAPLASIMFAQRCPLVLLIGRAWLHRPTQFLLYPSAPTKCHRQTL